MKVMDVEIAERTAEQWRTIAGPDNPAGPLYVSGVFAESDIVEAETSYTGHCSPCSASAGHQCC